MKEEFQVELLGVYPLKECIKREAELAKTSLFPKGLNGNAGRVIEITKEVRKKMSDANQKRVENGTHHFLSGEIQRKLNRERVIDGSHIFLSGEIQRKNNKERLDNGTHPFLDSEFKRKNNKKRVENGTHHFLSGEIQRKNNKERLDNGTHPSQIKKTCPHCNIVCSLSMFARWHGDKCKFNGV